MRLWILAAAALAVSGCATLQDPHQPYELSLSPDRCDPAGYCNVGKKP